MNTSWADRRRRGDDGMGLVEVLVAMALMVVVSAVVTSAVVASSRLLRATDDESRGLADVKTVVERLDRDIRDARGVVCDGASLPDGTPDPGCGSHLQLWIDGNSNYRLEASEVATWQLLPFGDGYHFKVIRTLDGVSKVQATSLVVNFAFTYDTAPTNSFSSTQTRVVHTGMVYDALYGQGTGNRSLAFTTRLRNAA
jgi:prepilin-type N-terminal cleavage/methylation domain-containing protein